jgi:hypothetical protein
MPLLRRVAAAKEILRLRDEEQRKPGDIRRGRIPLLVLFLQFL